jgi:hypothetical protein
MYPRSIDAVQVKELLEHLSSFFHGKSTVTENTVPVNA